MFTTGSIVYPGRINGRGVKEEAFPPYPHLCGLNRSITEQAIAVSIKD